MPTAARLIAALALSVTAYLASAQVIPLLPEGTDVGYFFQVNMGIGLAVGWVYMGKRAGGGLVPALNNGLTGAALLLLWALFVQGCWEMFRLAMRHRYGGPFDALGAIFTIAIDYFFLVAVPAVLLPLFVGGCISGILTNAAYKRWP